jgi:transposase
VIRGLMSDDEWAVFERFLASPSKQGGRPPKNHRRVLDGVFWIARTGAPWRDLPTEFGNWNSVSRQFRRWCKSGVWDVILQSFADSGGEQDLLQMIDSTVIRAHRCAAGIKGGLKTRLSGGHVVAFPPKPTSAPTPQVYRLPQS